MRFQMEIVEVFVRTKLILILIDITITITININIDIINKYKNIKENTYSSIYIHMFLVNVRVS